MPTRFKVPVVGMHFRPPAKAILQVLPMDHPLHVELEPENEYDRNAIKVMINSADIPKEAHSDLGTLAAGYGFDLDQILSQDSWHLGYVKATSAAELASFLGGPQPSHKFVSGKLSFDPKGLPVMDMEIEPA